MNNHTYHQVVEILRTQADLSFRTDQTNFDLGDILIKHCGTVDYLGSPRIDRTELKLLHKQLIHDRVPGTPKCIRLQTIANLALTFPQSERQKHVAWSIHLEAGSPKLLKTLLALHNNNVKKLSSTSNGTMRRYKEILKKLPNAPHHIAPLLAGAMANLRAADLYIENTIKLVSPEAKRLDADSIAHLVDMCEKVQNSAARCAALIDKNATITNKPKLSIAS